jgi:hypothetical protein
LAKHTEQHQLETPSLQMIEQERLTVSEFFVQGLVVSLAQHSILLISEAARKQSN